MKHKTIFSIPKLKKWNTSVFDNLRVNIICNNVHGVITPLFTKESINVYTKLKPNAQMFLCNMKFLASLSCRENVIFAMQFSLTLFPTREL